jgi:hypothetical protein
MALQQYPGLTRADLAACRACEAEDLNDPIDAFWDPPSGLPVRGDPGPRCPTPLRDRGPSSSV